MPAPVRIQPLTFGADIRMLSVTLAKRKIVFKEHQRARCLHTGTSALYVKRKVKRFRNRRDKCEPLISSHRSRRDHTLNSRGKSPSRQQREAGQKAGRPEPWA